MAITTDTLFYIYLGEDENTGREPIQPMDGVQGLESVLLGQDEYHRIVPLLINFPSNPQTPLAKTLKEIVTNYVFSSHLVFRNVQNKNHRIVPKQFCCLEVTEEILS